MLYRKIDTYVSEFYKNTNKALLIDGARQVGKSYAIEKFARANYKIYIECNFYKEPDLVNLCSGAETAEDILTRISLFKKTSLVPGETFIFFDEIQKCPDILTWIKFLVQDGRYRYALSGSLLGLEMSGIRSVPVGYVGEKTMYPLDFEEFLIALGVGEQIIERLRDCWKDLRRVDDFVHNQIMKLLNLYMIVGGMPAAVQKYVDSNDLIQVAKEQGDILSLYRLDIRQYNQDRQLEINEIFDLIPSELNAQNKRFILKNMHDKARYDRYKDDFLWLKNADMALPVYNVEAPVYPLKLNEKRNLFKLFQNDVGLLASQYTGGVQLRILEGQTNINFGAIYENFVAQELHAHGYELYYFTSKKQGELDFLISDDAEVIPIEVKSGKSYERHKALKNVLANTEYNIKKAYVLCNENLSVSDRTIYMPVYMIMFFHKAPMPDKMIYTPDLTNLS